MMFKKNIIIILVCAIFLEFGIVNPQYAQKLSGEEKKLEVIYSKNIEVFCTLINLTDFWERRHTGFPFASEARTWFLPFQKHQAVKMTNNFLKKQWHNFFCTLALYLTDFPEAKVIDSLPKEYSVFFNKEIENYLSAVRDFYKESNYKTFWLEKKSFYEELKISLQEKLKNINIPGIVEDFYGLKKDAYFIVPASQMPDMGLNVELSTGEKLYSYCVLGPFEIEKGPDYFMNTGDLVNTAFHEFGHTFLESVLDRQDELLQKYSYLYDKAKQGMDIKGYRTWHQVFAENLIRAVQARLMHRAFSEKMRKLVQDIYLKEGFKLVPVLYEITEEYVNNREKFRTFEDFFSVLFIRLDEKMKNL